MSIESALVALLLGVLVARFVSLLERIPSNKLRFWLAAWSLVFVHVLLTVGGKHASRLLIQLVDSLLVLLAMVCFILADFPVPARRSAAFVSRCLLPGVCVCTCASTIFGLSRLWCGAAALALAVVCSVAFYDGEDLFRRCSDFCVWGVTATLGLCTSLIGHPSAAIHIQVAALTAFTALLRYRSGSSRNSTAVAHSLGFLIWAAMIPVTVWRATLGLASLSPAVTHFPKLLVAVCMLLSLLEEEVEHARSAVSGERMARLALADAEQQVRRLVENAPVGIYRSTPRGKILFANAALLEMLGVPSFEQLARLNIEEVSLCNVPRSEFRRILEKCGKVNGFESFCTRADGTTILMREAAQVIYAASGEVLYYEGIVEDVTERQRLHNELVRRAYHDPLTGLPNRELLEEHLQTALARSDRSGTFTGLLCLDVDRFKQINDQFGHDIGDELLRQLALRVAARLRATDTFARIGGDEFMLVLTDIHCRTDAEFVAQDLLHSMQEPFEVAGQSIATGVSVGIAVYPLDARTPAELRRSSDQAMYRAKRNGRCRYETFDSNAERCAI